MGSFIFRYIRLHILFFMFLFILLSFIIYFIVLCIIQVIFGNKIRKYVYCSLKSKPTRMNIFKITKSQKLMIFFYLFISFELFVISMHKVKLNSILFFSSSTKCSFFLEVIIYQPYVT